MISHDLDILRRPGIRHPFAAAAGEAQDCASASLSDRDLMCQLCHGDSSALAALYERYREPSLSIALSIVRQRDLAEDIVQDAFLIIWGQAERYDPDRGTPRSWLFTIVHNRSIDRLRRQAISRSIDLTIDIIDSGSPDPAEVAVDRTQVDQLHWALMRLPEAQRRTIELSYLHGKTHVEIAELMECPVGTVKGRIRIGMEKLRGLVAPTM